MSMSTNAIRAGKAYVEFFIKDDRVDSDLAKLSKKFTKFGAIGMAATAPIVFAFARFAKLAADAGSALHDMSQRTGMSVESLSELQYAAEQSGTSIEIVEKALKELAKQGISGAEFDRLADEISAIKDPVQRAQAAMKAFGRKSGTALLPMLANLKETRAEARRLGLVMSTEDAEAADALGDAWDAGKSQLKQLSIQIGLAVAGPLTDFLKAAQPILKWAIDFIKKNPKLVAAIGLTATALFGVASAVTAIGFAMSVLAANPYTLVIAGIAVAAGAAAINLMRAADATRTLQDRMQSFLDAAAPGLGVILRIEQLIQGKLTGGSSAPATASSGTPYLKQIADATAGTFRQIKQSDGGWLVGSN